MLETLRTATRAEHSALEREMCLLHLPLSRERFIRTLQIFLAFHRAWEPLVAPLIGDEALLGPRRRLHLLQQDLARLDAAPWAPADFDLDYIDDRSAAWGSLYVMEGSTLGGQVITKALRRHAAWAPAEGISYFDPPRCDGPGAAWRGLCDALEAATPLLDPDKVVCAAQTTFRRLTQHFALQWRAAA
jgi:heme oxygenase (biliverdin-IX-beta and delta-forming)